jgi:uncharacterized lipoprotein YmbA
VFTEDGAITADPEATVEIDILRFDIGEDGEVNLVAEIAVERGQGHSATGARSVHLHMRPSGATTSALVKTMSDLLGQLADNVAAVLRGG